MTKKMMIEIEGYAVTRLSELDQLPIKNKLPEELKEKLLTRKQWQDVGYDLKEDAEGYELHPNCMAKRTSTYYFEDQVEPMKKRDI
jgi:hypothetical protein